MSQHNLCWFFFFFFFNKSICIFLHVGVNVLSTKKGTAICYSKYDFSSLVHAGLKYKLHFPPNSLLFAALFFPFFSFF